MTRPGPEHGSAPLVANAVSSGIDALRPVLVYAAFAALWILLSDEMMAWLYSDPAALVRASMLKGWAFVGVTSLLLYCLIRRLLEQTLAASRREIAAQKEKAHALQLLATIVDNSSDAIFAKDIEGRYLVFNWETARVVGKTSEDALGQDDMALFPPAQAEMIHRNDRKVLAENRIRIYEEVLDTVDGERRFQVTKGPLRSVDGKVVGIFGIARDITERLHAETALRGTIEELERFNSLAVGRELDMIALKRQVNALSLQLGLAPPHSLDFAEAPAITPPDQEPCRKLP